MKSLSNQFISPRIRPPQRLTLKRFCLLVLQGVLFAAMVFGLEYAMLLELAR